VVLLGKSVTGVTAAVLARFLSRARRAAGLGGDVTVLITSSAVLRRLNRRFRGQDHPTDVLSFPSPSRRARRGPRQTPSSRLPGRGAGYVGDIAIAADIARQNGKLLGHGAAAEIKVLILHGLLHLAGYDHASDNGAMARRELRLRRQLNLPQALIERAGSHPVKLRRLRQR
jgi:probable rRNA maturation factor